MTWFLPLNSEGVKRRRDITPVGPFYLALSDGNPTQIKKSEAGQGWRHQGFSDTIPFSLQQDE
jgi:hypothetical protein